MPPCHGVADLQRGRHDPLQLAHAESLGAPRPADDGKLVAGERLVVQPVLVVTREIGHHLRRQMLERRRRYPKDSESIQQGAGQTVDGVGGC